jgi:hypothetical protein
MPAQHPTPMLMTAAASQALAAEGYIMPESWPFPARFLTAEMRREQGWKLQQPGSVNDPEHPHWCANHSTYFPEPRHIAPCGTPFIKASGNSRPALVVLSKDLSPKVYRVAPGSRRPKWIIEDTPRGEIPEALRAWLLAKGERLAKGEKRLPKPLAAVAESFAIEPQEAPALANGAARKGRYGCGIRGIAAAVIGPRPRGKAGTEDLRAWERAFRKLMKDRPELFPSKGGK